MTHTTDLRIGRESERMNGNERARDRHTMMWVGGAESTLEATVGPCQRVGRNLSRAAALGTKNRYLSLYIDNT
jgi:hypothetical protein